MTLGVIQDRVLKDWIPAFAGMTMLSWLTERYRNHIARHPGESRDPS
jgi:hypothetical protein